MIKLKVTIIVFKPFRTYPAGNYLFKDNNGKPEQCAKSVQSLQ